jgi:hypothetical protein
MKFRTLNDVGIIRLRISDWAQLARQLVAEAIIPFAAGESERLASFLE